MTGPAALFKITMLLSNIQRALAATSNMTFHLGMLGPVTSVSQSFLAAVVAFDLDFRKNFDSGLMAKYGRPIVEIPDLHPQLRISPIIGTTDSNPKIAAKTAVEWAAGIEPFPAVTGFVAGMDSSIAALVAVLSLGFDTPQVAWGATSPELSDSSQYPYFLRTVQPDDAQGPAALAWLQFFGVPAAAICYGHDPHGEALFQAMMEYASNTNPDIVHGVAFPDARSSVDSEGSHLVAATRTALRAAKATGSRFMILFLAGSGGELTLYAMELEGMLYSGTYQILACDALTLAGGAQTPSRGLLIGFQKLLPVTKGPLFEWFSELWTKLTPSDLYSAEARQRYMLDDMRVTLENASTSMLTAADFAETSNIDPMAPFIFDAAYSYIFAINDLLNQGAAVGDVAGERLARHIREAVFEGVTGSVSFDSHGDRVGLINLWNLKAENMSMVVIGSYSSATRNLNFSAPPMRSSGEQNSALPASLLSCPDGFEPNAATEACEACLPGVGCGYQADEGFPIGILGPFTSVTQDFLGASVLFDLDVRKQTDPEIQARFGEPIIEVPNRHPDLKIKTQLGTSDSRVSIGMQTTLDWLLGIGGAYKVAGVVGGYHSSVSGPVASISEVYEVPQVSWASTSPAFTDKTLYPWFSRAIPSDSLQSAAMWAWMEHFEVPAVSFIYTREPYGEGLFQALVDIAIEAGQGPRVTGVGIVVMNEAEYDPAVSRDAALAIKNTGTKFMLSVFTDPGQATSFLYAMEELGMLYSSHQAVMADFVYVANREYVPSQGMPHGLMKFASAFRGQRYPQFLEMWNKMTPEDVYGMEANSRYLLNNFKVLPSQGAREMLTADDFASEPFSFAPFIIDAAYTFVFAINNLLNEGVAPQDIHGTRLLDAVRSVNFEGVTGVISYDQSGDRQGNYELYNVRTGNGGDFEYIGTWSAGTNRFTLQGDGNLTWAGGIISAKAPASLTACASGQRWDQDAGLCLFCPLNFFSEGGNRGIARCTPCEGGSVGNLPLGATGCVLCVNGTYRSTGEDVCTPCAKGTYTGSSGMSACVACDVGTYAPMEGLSECDMCGANRTSRNFFTTMSKLTVDGVTTLSYLQGATSTDQCGCDKGAHQDGGGECIACGTGMICPGMNEVTIQAGYYAKAVSHNGELSVFECFGDDDRCAGGVAGSTCATGRNPNSITCAECLDDMTPASHGSCTKCDGNDLLPIFLAVLCFLVLLVVTYYFLATANRATQSHALLLCAIAIGLLVTVTQQLGVVGMLSVDYKEPIRSFMHTLGLLAFDVELLRFNCVASSGPMGQYLLKICLIFICIVLMCLIHGLYVLVFHHGKFRQQQYALIGAVGTMFMVFYIAVATTVLEPIQCLKHPNGEWTVRKYPSVLCWSDDEKHTIMFAVGMVAFVLVPLAYLAACISIVRQLPRRMQNGDSEFLKAFSFLFFRFRPSQHSYVIATMLRSLFAALVLILPDVALQVFALQVILLLGFAATLHKQPWRVNHANQLDCILGASTLLVVCLTSLFLEDDQKDVTAIAWIGFAMVVTMLLLVPAAIVFGIYRRYFRFAMPYQFFLCHHKLGAGAYTRLLKMYILEHPKARGDVFVDSDNLDNLDYLFNYVGNDTSNLVVVCSAEIFSRPWCLGEMCTARLKNVHTILIMLPRCALPGNNFASELADRVDGLDILMESGMSIPMLVETMHWIQKQPAVEVPEVVTPQVMQTLVDRLINREERSVPVEAQDRTSAPQRGKKECLVVFDFANMEAAATALILKKMAAPSLTHESDRIPDPWAEGNSSPRDVVHEKTAVLTILCTNGVFEQPEVLRVLLLMPQAAGVSFLPVIAEIGFRFPKKDLAPLHKMPPVGMTAAEIANVAPCVQTLFKEIAITFQGQHMGESALRLAADHIARRLLNPLTQIKGVPSGTDLFTSSGMKAHETKSVGSREVGDSRSTRDDLSPLPHEQHWTMQMDL